LIDPSAIILHVATAMLTGWLAWIAYKTGKMVGFVPFWRRIMKGWILVGIGRGVSAFADVGILTDPNTLLDLRDFGLIIILIAVLFLIWGSQGLLSEMNERRNGHGD
jgi:hypothetical protein